MPGTVLGAGNIFHSFKTYKNPCLLCAYTLEEGYKIINTISKKITQNLEGDKYYKKKRAIMRMKTHLS